MEIFSHRMVVETRSSMIRKNTAVSIEGNTIDRYESRQSWPNKRSRHACHLEMLFNRHKTHKKPDNKRLLRIKRGHSSYKPIPARGFTT